MDDNFFKILFKDLQIPVIVCCNSTEMPIVFINTSAKIMLKMSINDDKNVFTLHDALKFRSSTEQISFFNSLHKKQPISDYKTHIKACDQSYLYVNIMANTFSFSQQEYVVCYVHNYSKDTFSQDNLEEIMNSILISANHSKTNDDAINLVLSVAGEYIGASRAYIFEDISKAATKNTYEWCAPGISPAISDLQYLKKEDYDYDMIMNESGMFICNDTRTLDTGQKHILYDLQSIKSIAIFPMYYQDHPLGYIGFDDCQDFRIWSRSDILFLKNIAGIACSFIHRRNAENHVRWGQDMMTIAFDNFDGIIFVVNIETYEIMLVNKSLADELGTTAEDIIGTVCWKILQLGQTGPCSFCPLPNLIDEQGNLLQESYVWACQSKKTNRWYHLKGRLVKWVDGKYAHLETGIDVTEHKVNEEKLQYLASIDKMTGLYNRQWGYHFLKQIYSSLLPEDPKRSLCFIDIDNLKLVNDTFGHAAGDDLIIKIVSTIRAGVRKDDMMCRWGGDEFILLMNCSAEHAKRAMLAIQQQLSEQNEKKTLPYELSFSCGITEFKKDQKRSLDTLITTADHLMYQNKMQRKN